MNIKKTIEKFSMRNFEQVISTIHSALPHLPRSMRKNVVGLLPYVAAMWGIIYIVTGLLPSSLGLGTAFFVSLKNIFALNELLVRVASILTGFILLFAFQPLKAKLAKGWDSLWFVSIFQIFFGLLFINVSAFIFVLVVWYILFEVREEYNTRL